MSGLFVCFSSASQMGTLETLIGRKLAILRPWLVRARCISIMCSCSCEVSFQWNWWSTTVMVLACQVGPFHLTLTQINSEMKCIAKNKCLESQKLHTRCRGENLNNTSDTCQDQQHVYFWILSLIYSMWGKKSIKKSYFHSETVLFCRMFVLLLECNRSVIQ